MPNFLPANSSLKTLGRHFSSHVGIGIVIATSYFDPGNWSVDLQAGSLFGYRPMLFVILVAGIGAVILQSLACKLGCVTGIDLAVHCRLLFHDHPKHPRLVRRLVLYPLYVLAEIAIISTDLAELLGSAIGFCLLIPSLPLWAGVVITALDVFVFLLLSDPTANRGKPAKAFEFIIMLLVLVVFICFIILTVRVRPDWPRVFLGYLPSSALFQSEPDAVYTAVGILGATVMPHALFLGSFFGTQDRVSILATTPEASEAPLPLPVQTTLKSRLRALLAKVIHGKEADTSKDYRRHDERENNSLTFIRAHLTHALADIIVSLMTLAVPINSAILIVSATVFYGRGEENPAGLFEAHALIKRDVGSPAAFVFALALICSGQTAGVAATLAGQIVSEGFIQWRISPFLRRIITRSISLVPAVVVAVAVGRSGLNTLLVASQVILSVVLPFIALPLIYLTSSSIVMRVRKEQPSAVLETGDASVAAVGVTIDEEKPTASDNKAIPIETPSQTQNPLPMPAEHADDVGIQSSDDRLQVSVIASASVHTVTTTTVSEAEVLTEKRAVVSSPQSSFVEFRNNKVVATLSYAIGLVVIAANMYAIVMLGLGRAGV